MCFICGERWSKDHQCKPNVQLHFVQELIDHLQLGLDQSSEYPASSDQEQVYSLSSAAVGHATSATTIQLTLQIQGRMLVFLVDSGSTHTFLNATHILGLQSVQKLKPITVKVAGGGTLNCQYILPHCQWSCNDHQFISDIRILPLGAYDGILGLDWLTKHSPMQVDWSQRWMSFYRQQELVTLHGSLPDDCPITLVTIASLLPVNQPEVPPAMQSILDQYPSVFSAPVGLPPRRSYDHCIPLIPGARPVTIRPYRVAPHLKTEIETQVSELLQHGMIRHSNSAFSSPVILVKKKDKTWRMVVDYRHLNAITIKGKYPLPVIDELLDELSGACWFSKLDLKAGYHQIRLAPGEEYKTAFQAHNGHFEFTVMAFGLTGAPGTFQGATNTSLAPVLRKFALVFFDDILIYSKTFEDHLVHVAQVLDILAKHQWKVKLSKCAFAQQRIAYLGHVISGDGVATYDSKISTIRDWPVPVNVKEVRGFLGITGYYRKFIRHSGLISKPLTNLLKKGHVFAWTGDTKTAFLTLKQALITAPVLALPDFSKQFVIETDACDVGIGAVLMQEGHPLAFVSKGLGPGINPCQFMKRSIWPSYLLLSIGDLICM